MTTGYQITYTVNGTTIPINSYRITGGSNGSVGSIRARTSRAAMQQLNIDLLKILSDTPANNEILTFVTDSNDNKTKIFGGEHVSTDWEFDSDIITIHGRDYAGILVDQRKVLSSLVSSITAALGPLTPGQSAKGVNIPTQNAKISTIVTGIAQSYGFTPVLHLGDDTTYGAVFGSDDSTFMPVPQSLWQILNYLAKETGNEVYVTPEKELVFGTPGAGLPHQDIIWNVSPDQGSVSPGTVPCKDLSIKHNPRRNASFRVLVFSYYASTKSSVVGRATVISPNLGGIGKLKAGIYSGADATNADKQISALQSKSSTSVTVPLYSFHLDGLTAAQADAKATAIANDISKRELILHAEVDILPLIRPTQIFKLHGNVDQDFIGADYYINQYTHKFDLGGHTSQHGGHTMSGLLTEIHALNIPVGTLGGKGGLGGSSGAG